MEHAKYAVYTDDLTEAVFSNSADDGPAEKGNLAEGITLRPSSSSETINDEELEWRGPTQKSVYGKFRRFLGAKPGHFAVHALLFVVLIAGTVVVVLFADHRWHPSCDAPATPVPTPLHPSTPPLNAFEKPCGDSAEEARARGCRFDVMSFLWLPEQCYDQQLIDEFVSMHPWEYYLDKNKTISISLESAITGEYAILYVSHEYHVRHCTLLWRKMHRALLSPSGLGAIDGYLGAYSHTVHCEHMLIDWKDLPLEFINTGLVRQFPSCGMLARLDGV